MASTSRTVKVRFDGDVRGLSAAAKQAEKDIARFRGSTAAFAKGFSTVATASGLGGAAVAAALPVVGSLALQFGVVKLAMGATNKEAKAYQRQLEAMKKPLQDLKNTAGKAFLPGVTQFLKDSVGLFPILNGAVERTGTIMGDTARDLGNLFKTERFKKDLDGFFRATEPVTRQIGDTLVTLTDRLIRFGSEMAPAGEGFAEFLDGLTDGVTGFLDALAPHADDFKSIWQSVGSILRDVLPIVGQVAGEMSENLAPILKEVADFVRENKDAISDWVPFLADAAVAIGGLMIATKVAGWLSGAISAISDLGLKADGAGKKVGGPGGLVGKLGGIKGLGAAAALGAVALAVDDINTKAAGGEQNLTGLEENLHDIVGAGREIATLNIGGILDDISAESSEWKRNLQTGFNTDGSSNVGKFFGWIKQQLNEPLPPITFDVNDGPAVRTVDRFIGDVNSRTPQVNINGNTNGAGFALRTILQAIDSGKGTVTIDGQEIPAQEALKYVVGLIDNSAGTVDINGRNQPAGQALADILRRTNASKASITVGASTSSAQGIIDGFIERNDGRKIQIYTSVVGGQVARGGIASAHRLATGGPVFGPGTGTSDTAGLFALSNGEHVLTAREVKAMGGHSSVMAMRRALTGGAARSFARSGRAAGGGGIQSGGGFAPNVIVQIDGQEFRGMIRTEITETNRQTRRGVAAGAYRGY